MATSLAANSPIVLLHADSGTLQTLHALLLVPFFLLFVAGEKLPHFAELDNAANVNILIFLVINADGLTF